MCGYGSSSHVKQRGDVVGLMGLKSNRRIAPDGGTYTSMASASGQKPHNNTHSA